MVDSLYTRITDGNFTVEDGMRCYTRDIVR